MQAKMRSQSRRYAIPYLRIQSPAVQQHKFCFSCAFGLPIQRFHPLSSCFIIFRGYAYVNHRRPLLAMPAAALSQPPRDLLILPAPFSPLPACCPRCGLPAADTTRPCGRCLRNPPPWQAIIFVSDYVPPLSTLIKEFKFNGKTELAAVLARQILLRWLAAYRERALPAAPYLPRPEQLFTVPLHKRRHWSRGFNQTELLARP